MSAFLQLYTQVEQPVKNKVEWKFKSKDPQIQSLYL